MFPEYYVQLCNNYAKNLGPSCWYLVRLPHCHARGLQKSEVLCDWYFQSGLYCFRGVGGVSKFIWSLFGKALQVRPF